MKIERIVLAVTDVRAMVEFYNRVFDCGLVPIGSPDSFHKGDFLGTPLLLCPNTIAEVQAEQNRHQFRVTVTNIDATAATAVSAGGQVVNDDEQDGRRVVGICDPDGNTYEITTSTAP